jgi:Kdo2-lipid IVA lauroyltransferase/acyltransferase
MQAILFYIGWGVIWAISLLPLRILYIISDGLYFLIYKVFKYRKNVVFKNLRNSFPEKDEKELNEIAKKFYHHFCDLLVETVKLWNLPKKEALKRIKWVDIDLIRKYYDEGKSLLVVCGHYGNWEASYQIGLLTKHLPLPVYKPLTNKYVDKQLLKSRTRYKAEPVPMNNIFRKLVQYKKENVPTLTALVSDQTPLRSEIQYWTKFLNQDTALFLGVEKMAKKFNYPVLYLWMDKPKRGFYNIYCRTLHDNPKETADHEITEMHVRALEEDIKRQPELWLWSHRRWKHKRDA